MQGAVWTDLDVNILEAGGQREKRVDSLGRIAVVLLEEGDRVVVLDACRRLDCSHFIRAELTHAVADAPLGVGGCGCGRAGSRVRADGAQEVKGGRAQGAQGTGGCAERTVLDVEGRS